jgi:hypothetical protein
VFYLGGIVPPDLQDRTWFAAFCTFRMSLVPVQPVEGRFSGGGGEPNGLVLGAYSRKANSGDGRAQ